MAISVVSRGRFKLRHVAVYAVYGGVWRCMAVYGGSTDSPRRSCNAVTVTGEMFLKPGHEFEPWDCDAEAARRHLSME